MIETSTTATFDKLFAELPKPIQLKAVKRTELFKANPFHPSLHTEKLHPKGHQVWSFRVDISYRVIFKFVGPNHAELRFIGHHNQIYNYDIFK
jgi:mRNA-degrading endonuclease RelE of RelBE toxin-antitoxin system